MAGPRTLVSRRRALWIAGLAALSGLPGAQAGSQEAPEVDLEDLGDGRLRLGQIEVDQRDGSFSVPVRLLDLGVPDAPLEFLVATRNGPKAYETRFEADADAYEFNLACILIGLDDANATPPRGNFDPTPAAGDPVDLTIEWEAAGEPKSAPIGAFLEVSGDEGATDDWVYIGSFFTPDGTYAADWIGLAVGFVHDQESIIQHAAGLGIVGYGSVTAREVPGVGYDTPLRLTVTRAERP